MLNSNTDLQHLLMKKESWREYLSIRIQCRGCQPLQYFWWKSRGQRELGSCNTCWKGQGSGNQRGYLLATDITKLRSRAEIKRSGSCCHHYATTASFHTKKTGDWKYNKALGFWKHDPPVFLASYQNSEKMASISLLVFCISLKNASHWQILFAYRIFQLTGIWVVQFLAL